MSAAGAYAVIVQGQAMASTVAPTRIGAMANGLLVLWKIMPAPYWSDEGIELMWMKLAAAVDAPNTPSIGTVTIEVDHG